MQRSEKMHEITHEYSIIRFLYTLPDCHTNLIIQNQREGVAALSLDSILPSVA